MDFLKFMAIQQAIEWAVFSIVAVAGAFAVRRWGARALVVVVILAWPVFVITALLNELRQIPQLLELNSFTVVFRDYPRSYPWVRPNTTTSISVPWGSRFWRSAHRAGPDEPDSVGANS